MSKFEVNVSESGRSSEDVEAHYQPILSTKPVPKTVSVFSRLLRIFGILTAVVAVIAFVGGLIYWQSLKDSPEYSVALLVDASRRGDQEKIDELIDTDAVVEDFVPQITEKAIELYGRGLPADTIMRVARVVAPVMPAVKDRARAELPGMIREKTEKFENAPYWAIAVSAGFYLDISREGDRAVIKSNHSDRPLELTLLRNEKGWRVVAVKDEVLAQKVAERVGQEIIALAKKGGSDRLKDAARDFGINDLRDIFDHARDILNQ